MVEILHRSLGASIDLLSGKILHDIKYLANDY